MPVVTEFAVIQEGSQRAYVPGLLGSTEDAEQNTAVFG